VDGSLDNVDSRNLDIFKEIGNIGAGNAATALANMFNKQIITGVPDVRIVPFNDIINIMDGPENVVAGVLVDMSGDLNGFILMVVGIKDAYEMISIALDEDRPVPASFYHDSMSELDQSALSEIANILTGAYLSAICTLTGLNITPSVPQLAIDMVGAIISIVAIEYGKIGDSVLFLKTNFSDIKKTLSGHFFLIPDYASYKILIDSLGMTF
jgi:chemotaxis protein CheC